MSTAQMKKTEDGTIERWESEISFSPEDKDRVLHDLPAFMKQLLEKQGHQVRRVIMSTEFEKLAQAAATSGGAVPTMLYHVQWPPIDKSHWIVVN